MKPGGTGSNQYAKVPDGNHSKLSEIGISKKQSSTFQQIAEIPDEDFEEFI